VRTAIVGGGIAGVLLALRLCRSSRKTDVDLFLGEEPPVGDASSASGGMVRGFEPDPAAAAAAAESMVEIRGSTTLSEWSGYRETGSVYLLAAGGDPAASMTVLDGLLPRSATLLDRAGLAHARLARDLPFRHLPSDVVGVVERRAGYISPHALRGGALAEATRLGVVPHRIAVSRVTQDPAVWTADGTERRYDAVVLATGAWTPRILSDSGLPDDGLRTKQIQYSVCRAGLDFLVPFVDERTGLYGRWLRPGAFLLGLPSQRWDVNPDKVTRDLELADRVRRLAEETFGVSVRVLRTVASFDCYRDPARLALRRVGTAERLYTFTGGSGGAAKTVLADSRAAAKVLLE
jgi:glycine/D-amino acid oxidase-like deaminating enzyme